MVNSIFTCEHISDVDKLDIKNFRSANSDGGFLAGYIKECAYDDEKNRLARTYIVRDKVSGEIAYYFSLRAGFIAINERKHFFSTQFDSMPGVEIANFAANGEYLSKHSEAKGLGKIVFMDFILPCAYEASAIVGAKYIYLFALPHDKLIDNYKSYGFLRLPKEQERQMHRRIKPAYDKGCIFMYQALT